MTDKTNLPLRRLISVADIPERGLDLHFEATLEECAAVAHWIDAPKLSSLTADYRLLRRGSQVRLTGSLRAELTRTCIASLEPFDAVFEEPVSMRFSEHASADGSAEASVSHDAEEEDLPDPIVNGKIDVGAVTAEFLSLGLDPYPRKSDSDFRYEEDTGKENPFAALAKLKGG
jgi:uncharacterized metal-binding protein YceD (DUF177 family)